MASHSFGVARSGIVSWRWFTKKFDPVLRHLARDVRVDPHDARIRVADPRTENRFFDAFAAAS